MLLEESIWPWSRWEWGQELNSRRIAGKKTRVLNGKEAESGAAYER